MVTCSNSTPSVLGSLPLHSYQVHYTTLCSEVADHFEQEPALPGVIIVDNAKLVGVISRQKFVDRIRFSFDSERYIQRAIVQALLHWVKVKPLDLPAHCPLEDAFQQAIHRSGESFCDPIVVTFENGKKALLDFQTLLLAYSQTSNPVHAAAYQPTRSTPAYLAPTQSAKPAPEQHIQAIKNQVSGYATPNGSHPHPLAQPSARVELPNGSHPHPLAQPSPKVEPIEPVDYRFIQVGRRLSSEGKQAFQTTWEMVDSAHHNTEHLISTSKVMVKELESLREVASLVGNVSKQTRFLGWHTRILANQLGGGREVDGFSRILSEFTQLNEQTLEAVRCMNGTANRLRTCVEELLKLAQGEAYLAQVLIHKVSQVKGVLAELDELLNHRNLQISPPKSTEPGKQTFLQTPNPKGNSGDKKIMEPDRTSEDGYLYTLIQSAEQKLQKSKKTMWRKWQQE